jgi:hypothetical protein
MLPARAEVASAAGASTPRAAGLEIAGAVLSGEVSGKYFILHRTRGNRSIIHEIFFDRESIGQVADDVASALTGTAAPRERKPGRHEPADGHTRQRDRTVLVRDTAIVVGRRRTVMGAQLLVAPGQVRLGIAIEAAERRRQAIAAMSFQNTNA